MEINKNLNLNRFNWAKQTVEKFAKQKSEGLNLFDIGSRDGSSKELFNDINVKYNGYDLEPLDVNIEVWDIETPYPYKKDQPDIILLLEVLEHLNNPWLCFKNLNAILKPSGKILISTPNPSWSDSRIHLLFKGKLTCFTQSDLDLNHHVFTPWPHIVEKLLEDCGFKIIEYSTIDGHTKLFNKPYGGIRFPFRILYRLIKRLIELYDRTACGMSYVIIAEKK